MTKVSFLLVIFVFLVIVSKSNSFSIRLPQEVETYLKNLAVTNPPETTTPTTIESEKTEQKSCWQNFSSCYSYVYNFITQYKIDWL